MPPSGLLNPSLDGTRKVQEQGQVSSILGECGRAITSQDSKPISDRAIIKVQI